MNHYTIKDLETLSGIKAHTIRIWEKRYGFLVPERTSTNIRYYSDEELKLLLNVAALVKRGHKISRVAAYGERRIHDEVLKLNQERGALSDYMDQLIIHIINFDTIKFEGLLDSLQQKMGLERIVNDLVFPLFRKIGVYWQIGSMFPAQEHLISNLVRQRFIAETARINPPASAPAVLFFLPENEVHELSLLYSQYLALKAGYRSIYLGQNVPFEDMKSLSQRPPQLAFIVSTFVNAIEKEKLEAYLCDLSKLYRSFPILVSGVQIKVLQPELPSNVTYVPDYTAFEAILEKRKTSS